MKHMSNSKASGVAKKTLAAVLSFAMIASSVVMTNTTADAKGGKVKKVKVTAPVTNGGTLVLKKGQQKQIKVKVTTSKKSVSKKVTYKSSNTKVAKIVKKKGKVYVKATGKKGKKAKITIVSKANKKKKATLKVKVGTPTKKISVSGVKQTQTTVYTTKRAQQKKDKLEAAKASSLPASTLEQINKATEKVTKKNVKAKKNKVTIYTGYTNKKNPEDEQSYSYKYKLNVKNSPSKATSKSYKYKSSKTSLLKVSSDGTLIIRKQKDLKKKTDYSMGTATVTVMSKDGSNKKAKIKVTVMAKANIKPVMVYEEDSRTATTIEDFESYKEGTKWERFTSGGYANSGTMTVVKDPENAKNKVLKITYDGKDQAFDFAPVFNLKLPNGKKLGDYSAIRLKSRVISNSSDSNYKAVYVYFDGKGAIKSTDYFATSNFDGTDPKKVPDVKNRFGVNISMATGVDKNYNVPDVQKAGLAIQDKTIIDTCADLKYNNKSFPSFYSAYSEGDSEAISPGFSEEETTEDSQKKAGFQQNTIEFDTDRIGKANIQGDDKTTPLLERNELDMVLGSTYNGAMGKGWDDYHVVLYLDDIQVMSGTIALKKLSFIDAPTKLSCGDPDAGTTGRSAKLQVVYDPKNTTQKELNWKSSDESLAKVESDGTVTANSDGKTGKVTITATSKANPAVSVSHEINIYTVEPAKEDYDVLASGVKLIPKGENTAAGQPPASNIDTFKLENGVLKGTYNDSNVSIVLDLGEEMDLNRYKGVEIEGICPGSVALEFYSSSFDMYQTKDNGFEKDWWETSIGKTYPFFVGSCPWRYEGGGMNYLKQAANGYTDPRDPETVTPAKEALRYSLEELTDEKSTGDWSKVRYIVVKTNKPPLLSYEGAWDANKKVEFNYEITGLKFLAEEVIDASDQGHYIVYNGEAKDAALKEEAALNVASSENNVTSYYADKISKDKPADKRDTTMNFSDFKYIKAKVTGTNMVKLGLIANGKTVADAVAVGEEEGDGDRSVYFSLANVDKNVLKNVDQICVETADGGKVTWVSGTKGEISHKKNGSEKKIDVKDGKATETTLEAYGSEDP